MSASTGIVGGVLGVGLAYAYLKPQITELKKENVMQVQQINRLQNEVQILKNTVSSQKNIITQKDEMIRQKDIVIANRDVEIEKLQKERKSVLKN